MRISTDYPARAITQSDNARSWRAGVRLLAVQILRALGKGYSVLALPPHRASIASAHGRLPAPSLATSDAPDLRRVADATFVRP